MAHQDIWKTKKDTVRKVLIVGAAVLVLIFLLIIIMAREDSVSSTGIKAKNATLDSVKSKLTSGAVAVPDSKNTKDTAAELSETGCTVQNERISQRLQDSQSYLRSADSEVKAARTVLEQAEAKQAQGQKEVDQLRAELDDLKASCPASE